MFNAVNFISILTSFAATNVVASTKTNKKKIQDLHANKHTLTTSGTSFHPSPNANRKRFWSFINSKKCDATGVAPLEITRRNHPS